MNITLRLIGPLVNRLGFSEKQIQVPEESTVETVHTMLGLTSADCLIVVRNGHAVSGSDRLYEGDRLAFSKIYSGG